jgi:hypothetical protein
MPNGPADVTAGAPNPADYTDNKNGPVTDNVTKLIWQQDVMPGTCNWEQAKDYCSKLPLLGYNDWRLPTRIELASLLDLWRSRPAINTTHFTATPSELFWSLTPLAGSSSNAWNVDFESGYSNQNSISDPFNVRCVRLFASANAPAGRYTITNGTVNDSKTKLTWQQAVPWTLYTWANAKAHCSGMNLAGTGWRLPTVKELLTIVDESQTNPSIDPTFIPSVPPSLFWSSSPLASVSDQVWVVHFDYGSVGSYIESGITLVRCVR